MHAREGNEKLGREAGGINSLDDVKGKFMQSQVRDESVDEGEIDFRRIVAIVSDSRWLILAVSGVFLLLSIVYVNFATPIYEANALVEVESQAHDLSNLSQLTSELGTSDQDSNTEVDIIQSRQVLGQAVDQEGLTVTVSPVGLWGLPFFPKISQSDISVGLMSVPNELEAEDIDLVVGQGGSYSVGTSDGEIGQGKVGELLSTQHGDFKLLISRLTAAPGSRFKITHLPRMMAIKTLFKALKVEKDSKTSSSGTIVLTLDGANKSKTISIVQSVANAYVAQNIRWRAEEANKSLDFLRDQLPKVKADLYKSEEALNSYRLKNGSLDMDMEVKTVLEQGALLQQQLGDLAVKQAEISHLYLPQHPVYKALLDERASVERQQESLKQRVADLPDSQQKLLRLTRDVEVNEQLYLQMFQKIQELDVESAGTVGNVRIIDNADAEWKPVRPKKLLVVALAIFLGAFSGFALSLVRTIMNPGIEGAEELESIGMPVLAIVPLSEEQQKVERDQKRSFGGLKKSSISQGRQQKYLLGVIRPEDLAIESLRGLRTSVHFSMMSARNKVLMISGPSPLVGKSFISSNLAVVLAHSPLLSIK